MCEADIDIRLLHYYLNSTTKAHIQENLDSDIKSDNSLDRNDFASSVQIGRHKKEEKESLKQISTTSS